MHIPNGFLTDPVCTASTLAATAALGVGFARLRQLDGSRSSAVMAATGAGIFAAQLVNFPIDHGTSAHVLGAALAAIALGPWCGMLTMTLVLTAQCLLFGDGGLSTLGANILNMAVAGTLVASVFYTLGTRHVAGAKGKLLGAAAAAFGSVLASASLCAIELAASGTYGLADVLSAMLGVHAVIGVSEALISVSIVAAALTLRNEKRSLSTGRVMIGGLVLAAAVAGLVAPLASTAPDGLERVAADLNFASRATSSYAIAPDYSIPGIAWPTLAMALAGIAGVVVVFVATYTVGRTATAKVRKQ
ncbi:MAG: energy-coupling factor ABC transporter permease [Planctomycetia bacterium]|nr:energy-coupling factor ABC transporter permease [Planctomycetia bacterium]